MFYTNEKVWYFRLADVVYGKKFITFVKILITNVVVMRGTLRQVWQIATETAQMVDMDKLFVHADRYAKLS